MNSSIREKTGVCQWRNTKDALERFKNIQDKRRAKFIKFDIEAFYPSTSKALLKRTLKFAREITNICEEDTNLILHACQSFLFFNSSPWKKKDNTDNFDVTKGSFFGAKVSEIVGLYILKKITPIFGTGSVGLYRDNRLGVLKESGPHVTEKEKP